MQRSHDLAHLPYPVLQTVSPHPPRVLPPHGEAHQDTAAALVARLASLIVDPDLIIARETVAQTFELDCASKIQTLVEDAADDFDRTLRTVSMARTGTQADVYAALLHFVQQGHRKPPSLVVMGDAGVGKSTVLRHVARRLSGDYLETTHGDSAFLCVFMPMYFVTLDPMGAPSGLRTGPRAKGDLLHDLLFDWWCSWVGGSTFQGAVRRDWLAEQMRSRPTLVILDGVDEFFTNNPAYGPADVRQMIELIQIPGTARTSSSAWPWASAAAASRASLSLASGLATSTRSSG